MSIFLPFLLNLPGNCLGSPKLNMLDLGLDYGFIALFEISICVQKFLIAKTGMTIIFTIKNLFIATTAIVFSIDLIDVNNTNAQNTQ